MKRFSVVVLAFALVFAFSFVDSISASNEMLITHQNVDFDVQMHFTPEVAVNGEFVHLKIVAQNNTEHEQIALISYNVPSTYELTGTYPATSPGSSESLVRWYVRVAPGQRIVRHVKLMPNLLGLGYGTVNHVMTVWYWQNVENAHMYNLNLYTQQTVIAP